LDVITTSSVHAHIFTPQLLSFKMTRLHTSQHKYVHYNLCYNCTQYPLPIDDQFVTLVTGVATHKNCMSLRTVRCSNGFVCCYNCFFDISKVGIGVWFLWGELLSCRQLGVRWGAFVFWLQSSVHLVIILVFQVDTSW
jgi:hypothetical protein